MTLAPSFKPRECDVCAKGFIPFKSTQRVCGLKCAKAFAKQQRAAEAKSLRERKEKALRLRDVKPLAQAAFNAWVRARDAELPCVSCGATNPPMTAGGQWDAGHFLSRGAYPEKAFLEDNCWKQCKVCNGGSNKNGRKALTVSQAYEQELLRRIGPERLKALKAPTPAQHWTVEDLLAIRDTYKAKKKELENG